MALGVASTAAARWLPAALALVAVVAPTAAAAERPRLEMSLSAGKVAVGDVLTIEVVAAGDYERFVGPTSDGLDLVEAGRASQVSIVNGHVERSERLTWQATGRRPGRWVIRGAQLLADGKVVAMAGDAAVEVTSAREALGPAQRPEEAAKLENYVGEPFFVLPQVSSSTPYAGQPFVLRYELYWSRNQQVTRLQEIGEPDYVGLQVEDLLAGKRTEQEAIRFGGAPYMRQLTRRVLLTAPTEGVFEVLGPRYGIDVQNFFDGRTFKVGPPPLRIVVRPLPAAGRPPTFHSASVGSLQLDGWLLERGQRVTRTTIAVGERTVIAYAVKGTGNLAGLKALAPPVVTGMRVEPLPDPGDGHIEVTDEGPRGQRTWQFTVSFDRPGVFVVPAQGLDAFDPAQERYTRSEAPALTVEVTGPPVGAALPVAGAPSGGADPGAPGTTGTVGGAAPSATTDGSGLKVAPPPPAAVQLRPLAPELGRTPAARRAVAAAPWWPPAAAAPWALAVATLLLGGAARRRRRRAAAAVDPLTSARGALAAIPADAGTWSALRAAVAQYLSARAGIALQGMTFGALRGAVMQAGARAADADALVSLLERCEAARFAPDGADVRAAAEALEQARTLLAALDATLQAAPSGGRRGPKIGTIALLASLSLAGAAAAPRAAHAATVAESFATANAAYLAGRFDEARRGYEELLAQDQGSAALHYNLGTTLVRLERLGAAAAHLRHAARLAGDDALATDIAAQLRLVRERLAEESRRRHRILHVFDESPSPAVALAQAAPQDGLAWATLLAGWLALALWWQARARPGWRWRAAAAAALLLHMGAAAWLWHATATLATLRTAVVIEPDVPLAPCSGVADPLELPEGLEVLRVRDRPDGRVEVQLPNGRRGCVTATALYELPGA